MDESKPYPGEPLSSSSGDDDDINRRRSTRLVVAVPVTISGHNSRGETFREETRTIVINPHGASIATSQPLIPGAEINVENLPLRMAVRARVTRFLERASSAGIHQIDVDLVEPKNIWGIKYPPADWQKAAPSAKSGEVAPAQTPLAGFTRAKPVAQLISVTVNLPTVAAKQGFPTVSSAAPVTSARSRSDVGGQHQVPTADSETLKSSDSAQWEGPIDAQLPPCLYAAHYPEEKENAVHSLDQKLADATARAEKSAVHLEELASKIEDARRQFHTETEQARESVREAVDEAFQAIRREKEENLSHDLESIRSGFLQETRRMAADQVAALSQEYKHEIGGSLSSVVVERLFAATGELEARQSRALEDTQERMGKLLDTSLQNFQQQLEQSAQSLRETALSNIVQEGAARIALEYESQKSVAAQQAGAQARGIVGLALEDFQTRLRQSAEDLRRSTAAAMGEELAAKVAVEVHARQAEMAGQAEAQIRTAAKAELEGFQAQLRQSAEDLRRSTAAAMGDELAAKAAAEVQAQQAEIASQIEAQAHAATQSAVDAIQTRIEQAEQTFRDVMLPTLTQECVAKSIAAAETSQASLVERARTQIQAIEVSSVEGVQAESARAAKQFRESVIPGLVREGAAASAEEMRQAQREAIQQTTEQIRDALQSALSGFEEQLRGSEQKLNKQAEELLRLPVQQINQYAENAVVLVREGISTLRASQVDAAQSQLAAMTRGALASMTEEVKATTEEYRNQLRAILEGLRERSAAAVEGYIREALDHSRESVMQQLQKDAEDFGTVAVAQFRSRAGEAVQDATAAVHKQVGSAAFVVKDWLDQGAQQMDARFAKLDARSDSALEAIDHRSQDLSRAVLDKFQKESESVLAGLRLRIQNAVKALDTPEPSIPPAEAQAESLAQQPKEFPVPSSDT